MIFKKKVSNNMNTKKIYLPSKRSFIDHFYVMDVLEKSKNLEKDGKKIFHFELGEPSARTPNKVIDEAKRLLNCNIPGYTPSNGILELRKKIVEFYKKKNVKIHSDQVFITPGSSGAFILSFLSCFNPGEKIAIFNPAYPAYRNILKSLGLNVVEIPTSTKNNFFINIKDLTKYKNIKGLIISSPNNPNGQIFSKKELNFIYNFCKDNKIVLISDEIYHGIEFGEVITNSLLSFGSDVIVVNSFSKYFCMAGWRLGWVIVPERMAESFLKLSQNLFISCNNVGQYAALKVFDVIKELDKNIVKYKKNRDYVFQSLSNTKWNNFSQTHGAFYTYIDVSSFTNNSKKLVDQILQDTGVALTSGLDFDKHLGNIAIRLSFSDSHENLKEGMDILTNWINHSY